VGGSTSRTGLFIDGISGRKTGSIFDPDVAVNAVPFETGPFKQSKRLRLQRLSKCGSGIEHGRKLVPGIAR